MLTRSNKLGSFTSSTLSPGFAGRWIFSTTLTLLTFALTPPLMWGNVDGYPLAGLVINEIMKDPVSVSDSHGEYVELFNPNSYGVEINNWVIKDRGNDYHVIESPEPLVVEPFSCFVLARDSSSATNGGFNADYQYSSFTLSNGSDEVILLNSSGHTVDGLAYDTDEFPDIAGSSMELRNPLFNNIFGYNWYGAVTPYGLGDLGTPGTQNSVWEVYKDMTLDIDVDSIVTQIGDTIQFDFYLTAQASGPVSALLFADLWMPDGDPFPNNPLYGPLPLFFDTGERWEKTFHMNVPSRAELGEYRFIGYLVDEGGEEIDSEDVVIRVVSEEMIKPGEGRPDRISSEKGRGCFSWIKKY